jgi:hypothetical protein
MAGTSQCLNCHQESDVISQSLSLCASCIKKDFEKWGCLLIKRKRQGKYL